MVPTSEDLATIGALFTVASLILLAMNVRAGWIIQFIGCAAWAKVGVDLGVDALWMLNTFLSGLAVYGFVNWREVPGADS